MAREHSVNLIKSYNFDAGIITGVEAGDVDLEEEDALSSSSSCSKTAAIYAYFQDPIRKDFSDSGSGIFLFVDGAYDTNELSISLDHSFVNHFCSILPEPFLVIRIDLRVLPNSVNSKAFLLEKRLELREMLTPEGEDSNNFLDNRFPFPNDFDERTPLSCSISLGWMETETPSPIKICLQSFMEKLFADDSTMDLTIVAENGAEIKCHTLIFAAHTPVFSSMLSSSQVGMTEAQTKRIELGENSEKGIRHLVHYLYGMELGRDDVSSDVALELFQLAHKYGLSELEESLLKLLLGKGMDWFTPDVILEVYFYVRNVDVFEKLREHALALMASIPPQELRSCEEFDKLDKSESVNLSLKLIEYLQKSEGGGNGRGGVKRRRSDSEQGSTERKKCNCN